MFVYVEGAVAQVGEEVGEGAQMNEIGNTLEHGANRPQRRIEKRKAADSIIEENTHEAEDGGTSGTQLPNILPPVQVDVEPTPEACITQQEMQHQPPVLPVYKPGPSMYQQLSMSNSHSLQPRVQIRAAPPMFGSHGMPTFTTVSRAQSGTIKPIITDGGKKYLDLSQLSSSNAQ
ncbi:hypothetical protein Salat_2780200 [Sesamum alatum]|uniref:Uncharacterized protein n=1 Tax=Sesamum alatum TaxID=300844 RepID=A0AAE2C954_9LAMI|nr:hypothetical protein Salat_2780200 [Sesamum alatum]